MPQPAAGHSSAIFISYRRKDSAGHAGRLYDRLTAHFGEEQVSMDVDLEIEPGEDFVLVIEKTLGSCQVLLALIGLDWLASIDEAARRPDHQQDYVRLEIATALASNIRVIPVLVQGAQMPRQQDLPEDLKPLARRQAIELSDLRWRQDAERLIRAIERALARRREPARAEEGASTTTAEAPRPRRKARTGEKAGAGKKRRDDTPPPPPTPPPKRRTEVVVHRRTLVAGFDPAYLRAAVNYSLLPADGLPPPSQPWHPVSDCGAEHLRRSMQASLVLTSVVLILLVGAMLGVVLLPRPQTGTTPQKTAVPTPSAGPAPFTNGAGIEFVWVPPGSFLMGSENGELDERPPRMVTIREGFYMGRYEVTQAQWQRLMGNNPSTFKGDDLPVEQVSWTDAVALIAKLNAQNDGYRYRLPSEAQWEYAARAGTTGEYAGDLAATGWYGENSDGRTHPVGTRRPNAFGLYDMHGNVWEWCQDKYHPSYEGAPTDGSAWLTGGSQKMVKRGGSWFGIASRCRSARRDMEPATYREDNLGFRLVAVART